MARRVLPRSAPRGKRLFIQVWDEIVRCGKQKVTHSYRVDGGRAVLEGMPEIAEQIFDLL